MIIAQCFLTLLISSFSGSTQLCCLILHLNVIMCSFISHRLVRPNYLEIKLRDKMVSEAPSLQRMFKQYLPVARDLVECRYLNLI